LNKTNLNGFVCEFEESGGGGEGLKKKSKKWKK